MPNTQEKANKYDFPVALTPIYTVCQDGSESTGYKLAEGRKAVERLDNRKVLGVVSDKYKILPHAQVVEGFRDALAGKGFEEKIRVTKGGARLYLNYVLPSVSVEVRKGDIVNLQLIAVNSYDGSKVLQVMFGAFRLVCENGLIIGEKFISLEQRHVGAIGIKVDSLQMQVADLTEQFRESLPLMQKLAATDSGIGTDTFRGEAFSEERVNLPEYLLAQAYNEFVKAKDNSLWGLYNAYTNAITHSMRRESPEAQIRYGRVAWEAVQSPV